MDLKGVTLLGKYVIDSPLGEGGMGSVWLGRHKLTGRKVAIKMLDEKLLKHPEVVERFGREARAASAIQHPGIVEVLDLDKTDDGRPVLVMEVLEGEPLSARIEKKGRLGEQEAIGIMCQLLEALDAAHAHGVVHRDLKPDNIFLVPRGRGGESVKILDFGISHKADERVSKLTQDGAVLGTPHYMAPEQAMGDSRVDGRTDIYAAGVVFYECLVGTMPFDGPNYNALLHMILTQAPERPSARGVKLNPHLEQVIMDALSKKREERPQTAGAMLERIQSIAEESDDKPPSSDTESDQLKPADGESVPDISLDLPPSMPLELDMPAMATPPTAAARASAAAPLSLDPDFGAPPEGAEDVALDADGVPIKTRVVPWQLKVVAGSLVVVLMLVVGVVALKYFVLDPSAERANRPPPPPPPEAPKAAVLTSVLVEVRGVPAGASLRLDGFPPSRVPFSVRPGTTHVLEVQAEGFEPWKTTFTPTTDMEIPVRLLPRIGTVVEQH